MVKGGSVVKPLEALIHLIKKPHTIRYPAVKHRDMLGETLPNDRYRGFHTNDLLKCIGCGMCGRICMNQAITYVTIPELKGITKGVPRRPVVDYGRCCYCGLCTQVCPTGSLKMVPAFKHISTDRKSFRFMPTPDRKAYRSFQLDVSRVAFPGKANFEEDLKRIVERLRNTKGEG